MVVTFRAIATGTDATPIAVNNALNDLAQAIEDREDGTVAMASPQISSFANALHDHEDNAGGGKLSLAALDASLGTDGQVPTVIGGVLSLLSAPGTPAGGIIAWVTDSPPSGFLLCDGSSISRATYADLFAVIGTDFGNGDGSTTFDLPDLRGRVIIGLDDMGTGTGAADRVTSNEADTFGGSGGGEDAVLPRHRHSILWSLADSDQRSANEIAHYGPPDAPAEEQDYGAPTADFNGGISRGSDTLGANTGWAHYREHVRDINTTAEPDEVGYLAHSGVDASGGNLPPWLALNFIIKT